MSGKAGPVMMLPWRTLALIAASLAATLGLWIFGLPVIGGGLLAKLDRMTELREREASSHRVTKANFRAAQADATKAQAAANSLPAQKSALIAEITNATSNLYLDSVRRAAADRMQPGSGSPAQCAGSASGLPGAHRAAVGDVENAGPAGGMVPDPDSILVSRSDWSKITAAAGQAAMCASAGQALIADGVAVKGRENLNEIP